MYYIWLYRTNLQPKVKIYLSFWFKFFKTIFHTTRDFSPYQINFIKKHVIGSRFTRENLSKMLILMYIIMLHNILYMQFLKTLLIQYILKICVASVTKWRKKSLLPFKCVCRGDDGPLCVFTIFPGFDSKTKLVKWMVFTPNQTLNWMDFLTQVHTHTHTHPHPQTHTHTHPYTQKFHTLTRPYMAPWGRGGEEIVD